MIAAPTNSSPAALWAAYQADRSDANRNALVECYLPLAIGTARAMHKRLVREVQFDDLVQWGSAGLLRSIERFDPARGIKFQSFVSHRIKGAMLDGLRESSVQGRKTLNHVKELNHIEQALQGELGRAPTPEETAGRLKLNPRQYTARLRERDRHYAKSIDHTIYEGEHQPVTSLMTLHDSNSSAKQVENKDFADHVMKFVLENCKLTEALAMKLYFLQGLSMSEIGPMLGRTECHVSMLLTDMLRRIRFIYRKAG